MMSKHLSLFFITQVLLFTLVRTDIPVGSLTSSTGATIDLSYSADNPSVKSIGDINGDGFSDFAIGIPSHSYFKGQVVVIYGSGSGIPSIDIANLTPLQGFSFIGELNYDKLGYAVTGLGDVNGDGFADFAVSATTGGANFNGAVYVIYGKSSSSFTNSGSKVTNFISYNGGFTITKATSSARLGFSIAGAGDVNGDNIGDIIIGAPYESTSKGRAYLVYGKSGATRATVEVSTMPSTTGFYLTGTASGGYFGWSVAAAGDMNGDNKADVIIGVPGAKTVYVLYGTSSYPTSGPLQSISASMGFKIISSIYALGYSVQGNGDVNNDGKKDIIIGCVTSVIADAPVFVIFGSGSSSQGTISVDNVDLGKVLRISTYAYYTGLGYAVSIAGDVNGDNIDDILVSAPGIPSSYGALYVIFGTSSISSIQFIQPDQINSSYGYAITSSTINPDYGSTPYNFFGAAISASGNLNSNAIVNSPKDILISERASNNGDYRSKVYVVYGTSQSTGTYTANSANTGTAPTRGTRPTTSYVPPDGSGAGGDGGNYTYTTSSSTNFPIYAVVVPVFVVFAIALVITFTCIRRNRRIKMMKVTSPNQNNTSVSHVMPPMTDHNIQSPDSNHGIGYSGQSHLGSPDQGIQMVQSPHYGYQGNPGPVYAQPQQNINMQTVPQYPNYSQPQQNYNNFPAYSHQQYS